MAEEEKDPNLTDDDLNALRVLLHNVKGLSAVSFQVSRQDELTDD